MKWYVYTALFVLLASCTTNDAEDKSDAFHRVQAKYIHDIQAKYDVRIGSYGGGCLHAVDEFSLGLEVDKKLSIEEARKILVGCAEMMLKTINTDRAIRPYLREYPFPDTKIFLYVYFRENESRPVKKPGQFLGCSLSRGKIKYDTVKRETRFATLDEMVPLHQETYEEAKKIEEDEKKSQK